MQPAESILLPMLFALGWTPWLLLGIAIKQSFNLPFSVSVQRLLSLCGLSEQAWVWHAVGLSTSLPQRAPPAGRLALPTFSAFQRTINFSLLPD